MNHLVHRAIMNRDRHEGAEERKRLSTKKKQVVQAEPTASEKDVIAELKGQIEKLIEERAGLIRRVRHLEHELEMARENPSTSDWMLSRFLNVGNSEASDNVKVAMFRRIIEDNVRLRSKK